MFKITLLIKIFINYKMQDSFYLIDSKTVQELISEIQELKEMVRNLSNKTESENNPNQYLNREKASDYLNLGTTSFDRYVKQGEIPYRYIGKRKMYQVKELDEYTIQHRNIKLKI